MILPTFTRFRLFLYYGYFTNSTYNQSNFPCVYICRICATRTTSNLINPHRFSTAPNTLILTLPVFTLCTLSTALSSGTNPNVQIVAHHFVFCVRLDIYHYTLILNY
nr:MAG TPA: hypothetical protein [Caudoviricetes sp.]